MHVSVESVEETKCSVHTITVRNLHWFWRRQSFSQFWNGESAHLTCKRIIPGHCAVAGEHKCAPVFYGACDMNKWRCKQRKVSGTGTYTQAH